MAAVKKIPVAQITKDFAIKQKELFDLLKAHGLDKKSGTPFSEAEFSFFLAALTADRQIENLDDYLQGKARILCGDAAEAPAPAPVEEKPAPAPVEEKKPEEKKAEEKKPEEKKPEAPKAVEKKAEAPKPVEKKPERKPEPKKPVEKKPVEKKVEAPKAERAYAPAEAGSNEEKIEQFIKGLLENMGSQAVPHCWADSENSYRVDLTGEGLGFLIGRRGETLDAIQHLANYAVNRSIDGHVRINVDAESYREKREDSLRRYARKKAQQVLKARRRTTLEPMNAYERHVIHAALQDMENITTHSTGTEPNRRVVIEYVR